MNSAVVLSLCVISTVLAHPNSYSFKTDKDLMELVMNDMPGEPLDPADLQLARDSTTAPSGDPESMREDPSLESGFYEGDIIMDKDDLDAMLSDEGNMYRNAVVNQRSLWPNGVVPYVISSSYDANARSIIMSAIRAFSDQTCIKFIPRTHQSAYIHIVMGDGCSSHIGFQNQAQQPVSIGDGCINKGIIMHEFLHALGFWHEQSRPDRDQFIKIDTSNIRAGMEFNFKMASTSEVSSLGVSYDLDSVLHYGPYAFAANRNKPTIIPLIPAPNMGQRNGFSKKDIEKVNKLYCETKPIPTPNPSGSSCVDYSTNCAAWSANNGCSNYAIVRTTCPKTCAQCESCDDQNNFCPDWASSGECTKNPEYMTLYCRKSCGICGANASGCADLSEHCGYWSQNRECETNPDYMLVACKKSCKQC